MEWGISIQIKPLRYKKSTFQIKANLVCYKIEIFVSIVNSRIQNDRGFEPRSGQAKEYKIVFSASRLSMQH